MIFKPYPLLLIVLVVNFSCASNSKSEKHFAQLIAQNKCEEASSQIPLDDSERTILSSLKHVGGGVGSYTVTFAVLLAAIAVAAEGGDAQVVVAAGAFSHLHTKFMRCPDIDHVSSRLRQVVHCYKDRGDTANIQLALSTTKEMKEKEEFYWCLGSKERGEFDKMYASLAMKFKGPLLVIKDFEKDGIFSDSSCKFKTQIVKKLTWSELPFYDYEFFETQKNIEWELEREKANLASIIMKLKIKEDNYFFINLYECS